MFLSHNEFRLLGIAGILLSITFASASQAETCSALNVIGATGTKVTKTVSPIGTLVTNNNWNTDFAVPSTPSFNRYVGTVIPENNATYDVRLSLKYSDTSAETYRKDNVSVKVGKPLTLVGEPKPKSDPFQVNVYVGGINAIGNTYTVSVVGCI